MVFAGGAGGIGRSELCRVSRGVEDFVALVQELVNVGEPTKAVLLPTPDQFRAVDVHIVEPADRVG